MKLTWPILFIAVTTPLTILTTYHMAVRNGHVNGHYPFVSDTFAFSPERAIAGVVLNVVAFVIAALFFFRHLQIKEYVDIFNCQLMLPINKASLTIGLIAASGLTILANCQADGILMSFHITGSFIFYLGLAAYMVCECGISVLTPDCIVSRRLVFLRICITTADVLSILIMIQQGLIAVPMFTGQNDTWHYNPFRVTAAILEWLILILVVSFLCTYYRESEAVTVTLAGVSLDFDKTKKAGRVVHSA